MTFFRNRVVVSVTYSGLRFRGSNEAETENLFIREKKLLTSQPELKLIAENWAFNPDFIDRVEFYSDVVIVYTTQRHFYLKSTSVSYDNLLESLNTLGYFPDPRVELKPYQNDL